MVYQREGPMHEGFREPRGDINQSKESNRGIGRYIALAVLVVGLYVATPIVPWFISRYVPAEVELTTNDKLTARIVYRSRRKGQEFPVEIRRFPETYSGNLGSTSNYTGGLSALVTDCQGDSSTREEISNALTSAYLKDRELLRRPVTRVPYTKPAVDIRTNNTVLVARDPSCI